MDEIDENDFRYRVVTSLKLQERVRLEELAWESGRSMSGYIRFLVIKAIEDAD